MLDIPVMHDDQHGTAIVALAALRSAARVVGKDLTAMRAVVCGAGASGIAVSKILLEAGVPHIVGCDSRGALHVEREDYRDGSMPAIKRWFAEATNPDRRAGTPADVIDGMDLFVGVSGARVLPAEALARMNGDAMVFAMANPNPEVTPEAAAPYVRVMATGRSDYPNQINNVLAFPGVFRGMLDAHAEEFTEEMALAAARAIADAIGPRASIKPPNDVLVDGRKAAGILAEAGERVVLGIGINVNVETDALPLETRLPATSLLIEAGRRIDRVALLVDVLARLERHYGRWLAQARSPD
jgi:malic enzyme